MPTYAHMTDGNTVDRVVLPVTGTLTDGRAVSGYDRLPADVLHAEGWREVQDNGPPAHDADLYRARRDLQVQGDEVHAIYTVEALPPRLDANRYTIPADDTTEARVTYYHADGPAEVTFTIDGQDVQQRTVAVTDGKATLRVRAAVPGEITVTAGDLQATIVVEAS